MSLKAKRQRIGMTVSELPERARLRLKHAGRWVAWSEDLSRVIAVADDPETVHEQVRKAGVEAIYEWVPPVPIRPIDPEA